MGFFDMLFRRTKQKGVSLVDCYHKVVTPHILWKNLLVEHVDRLKKEKSDIHGFNVTKTLADKLVRDDIMKYTTDVIDVLVILSISEMKHNYQTTNFDDLYVAFSTIPTSKPSEMKEYFKGGYISFIDKLQKEWKCSAEEMNIAHWIIGFDNDQQKVHLSILPFKNIMNGIDALTIVAQDLLTDSEKSKMGIV